MSLKDYGGGNYLSAKDLKDGLEGRIMEQPKMEEKDFGGGEELKATFIMEVENEDEPKTWSPGKFAVGYLIQTLGDDESRWDYPVPGYFEQREVQTKYGKKDAWFFIPKNSVTKSEEKPTPKTSKIMSHPIAQQEQKNTTGTKSDLKCPFCEAVFGTKLDRLEHMNKKHKDELR